MKLSLGNSVSSQKGFRFQGYPCLTFNGVDEQSRLIVPDNTDLDISTNLTVTVWAKNDNSALGNFSRDSLMGKYDFDIDNYCEWYFGINGDEKVEVLLSANGLSTGNVWESTSAVASLSDWNHYAFVYVGGTSLTVYLNGAAISGSFTSGSLPASIFNGPTPLNIGSVQEFNASVWAGQICDARIYNTNLSVAQILSIYGGGTPASGNLAAWYPLNEGTGSTATDVSGNGNNGTLTNFDLADAWAVKQKVFNYTG